MSLFKKSEIQIAIDKFGKSFEGLLEAKTMKNLQKEFKKDSTSEKIHFLINAKDEGLFKGITGLRLAQTLGYLGVYAVPGNIPALIEARKEGLFIGLEGEGLASIIGYLGEYSTIGKIAMLAVAGKSGLFQGLNKEQLLANGISGLGRYCSESQILECVKAKIDGVFNGLENEELFHSIIKYGHLNAKDLNF